jgi:hypothetical protein
MYHLRTRNKQFLSAGYAGIGGLIHRLSASFAKSNLVRQTGTTALQFAGIPNGIDRPACRARHRHGKMTVF